uniref:SH2 domain-containing protein n=1 Tax=Nothobranchius furzeri TaxID=105023 RepID=A0A8C6LSW5_NOTFU
EGKNHTQTSPEPVTDSLSETTFHSLVTVITLAVLFDQDREKMEQREPAGDSVWEGTEGRLRELASKWFIDTQLPLIVNNGLFPSWFMGFISRKDAENVLREKELGCFLIRLSDKAIGYILSYKGRDRCRHFLISQSEVGKFKVHGDTEGHSTMLDLIDYYKTSPIEPFGEYLTYPCCKNEDLYDTIQVNPKEKPASVLRTEVPPLPQRSRQLDASTFTDEERSLYAQLKKHTVKDSPRGPQISQDSLPGVNPRKAERLMVKKQNNGGSSPPSGPEAIYSELNPLDTKSKSLPLLDSMFDGEQSYRLSMPPSTPPRLSPKPVRPVTNCTPQSKSSHSLDGMTCNAVYHMVGPTTFRSSKEEQQNYSLYAEVGFESPVINIDSTYELLPDHKEPAKPKHHNTYEPVEDNRRKINNSSWGIKMDNWQFIQIMPHNSRNKR